MPGRWRTMLRLRNLGSRAEATGAEPMTLPPASRLDQLVATVNAVLGVAVGTGAITAAEACEAVAQVQAQWNDPAAIQIETERAFGAAFDGLRARAVAGERAS